jgi:MFS family permease
MPLSGQRLVMSMVKNAVANLVKFIERQPKPFKVNMMRAAAQSFLTKLLVQYRSIYILRLGATPFQLGMVTSVAGTSGTAIALPAGWLADKHGIRRIFLSAIPVMALGSLLFAVAGHWIAALPALLLVMLGTQLLGVACPMVCGTYLKQEERATGKQLCDTLSALPTLIAPIIAAAVIAEFGGLTAEGIRPLFFLQALGFVLMFLFTYKFYFDTRKAQTSTVQAGFGGSLREVFKTGMAVTPWAIYIFLSSTTFYANTTFLSAFVTEVKFGDEFVVGSMTAASMVLPLTISILLGRAADTLGRKKVLYSTIPLYAASLLLLIYAQDVTMLLISAVLQGFYLLSAVTQGAITAELVPVALLGSWYGLLNLLRGLASITAPVIGGVIWTAIGPQYVFFFMILMELSKLIILRWAIPETLKSPQGAVASADVER